MARRETGPAIGPTKADLTDKLQQIEDLAKEALDPELTREELVVKLKEIADVASGEGDDEGDELDSSVETEDEELE